MRSLIITLALILATGCVAIEKTTGPGKEFQNAAVLVKEKNYQDAVAACKKILTESPESELAADARYEIALIHATPENPQRDFPLAMREFEEFHKLYPEHQRAPEARSWGHILKIVLDLKKENEHLNKNIEELKQLDIRHEERRRK